MAIDATTTNAPWASGRSALLRQEVRGGQFGALGCFDGIGTKPAEPSANGKSLHVKRDTSDVTDDIDDVDPGIFGTGAVRTGFQTACEIVK